MNWEAFFRLHREMPRQGPGEAADVHWALERIAPPARVLDAACGPGADTETLAAALPRAQITAVDQTPHLAAEARTRLAHLATRVRVTQGDMFDVTGPFDLIWCAAALYGPGVTTALQSWRRALAPGGHVAFSEPLAPAPDAPQAAHDFWRDYPAITDRAGTEARIAAAGFRLVALRTLALSAWRTYYDPLQVRIDRLRGTDDADLRSVLAEGQREIDLWRAAQDHVTYALFLVTPDV